MTHVKELMAAVVPLAMLGGCESMEPPSKQEIGLATSAILGGVLGHQIGRGTGQTVATIGGAALGAFLGSRIGARMDRNDQLKTAQALETSKIEEPTTWRNPDTRQRYTVTPTRAHEGASGPCREFTTMAQIDDGRHDIVQGTACRQADGAWRVS
jgi:surface antigen